MAPSSKKKLGFFDLPLEIRDIIYARLLHTRIFIHEPGVPRVPTQDLTMLPGYYRKNMNIFKVSKAVKAEALRLIFSEGIFSISYRALLSYPAPIFGCNTDMVKHIQLRLGRSWLHIGPWPVCEDCPQAMPQMLFASSIRFLGGLAIRRRTCEIEIARHHCILPELMREPCLGAITSLVGFETLTVKLCIWCISQEAHQRALNIIHESLLTAFAALGQCVVCDDGITKNDYIRRYVWHPRKFVTGGA